MRCKSSLAGMAARVADHYLRKLVNLRLSAENCVPGPGHGRQPFPTWLASLLQHPFCLLPALLQTGWPARCMVDTHHRRISLCKTMLPPEQSAIAMAKQTAGEGLTIDEAATGFGCSFCDCLWAARFCRKASTLGSRRSLISCFVFSTCRFPGAVKQRLRVAWAVCTACRASMLCL